MVVDERAKVVLIFVFNALASSTLLYLHLLSFLTSSEPAKPIGGDNSALKNGTSENTSERSHELTIKFLPQIEKPSCDGFSNNTATIVKGIIQHRRKFFYDVPQNSFAIARLLGQPDAPDTITRVLLNDVIVNSDAEKMAIICLFIFKGEEGTKKEKIAFLQSLHAIFCRFDPTIGSCDRFRPEGHKERMLAFAAQLYKCFLLPVKQIHEYCEKLVASLTVGNISQFCALFTQVGDKYSVAAPIHARLFLERVISGAKSCELGYSERCMLHQLTEIWNKTYPSDQLVYQVETLAELDIQHQQKLLSLLSQLQAGLKRNSRGYCSVSDIYNVQGNY